MNGGKAETYMTEHRIIYAKTNAHAVATAVEILTANLDLTLVKYGSATLMLSGGGSPKPVYEALSKVKMDWSHVSCGLVDERWVPEDHSASNTAMIRKTLVQNKAEAVSLYPMTNSEPDAKTGASDICELYHSIGLPYDICVMGMGSDGHTASWFPGSPDLESALDMNAQHLCMGVDASGCEGAGDITDRITLSRAAVLTASLILLYIPSRAKRKLFEIAVENYINGDLTTLPVASLLDAGKRLIVITSEV